MAVPGATFVADADLTNEIDGLASNDTTTVPTAVTSVSSSTELAAAVAVFLIVPRSRSACVTV